MWIIVGLDLSMQTPGRCRASASQKRQTSLKWMFVKAKLFLSQALTCLDSDSSRGRSLAAADTRVRHRGLQKTVVIHHQSLNISTCWIGEFDVYDR